MILKTRPLHMISPSIPDLMNLYCKHEFLYPNVNLDIFNYMFYSEKLYLSSLIFIEDFFREIVASFLH